MNLKPPKKKKFAPNDDFPTFPVVGDSCFIGVFNGYNVQVSDHDAMMTIYYMGNFGKGNMSKSAPNYHALKDDIPKIIYKQQWENQQQWKTNWKVEESGNGMGNCLGVKTLLQKTMTDSLKNFLCGSFESSNQDLWHNYKEKKRKNVESHDKHVTEGSKELKSHVLKEWFSSSKEESTVDQCLSEQVEEILKSKNIKTSNLILRESCSKVLVVDAEDNNVKPDLKDSAMIVPETLNLSLQESFFLCFAIGCLKIHDLSGHELKVQDVWHRFRESDSNFIEKYVAYHYYRAKGWTVKHGIKFGGDYLLYKTGPAYYHGSFLVKVMNSKMNVPWNEFIGINRLVETFNKDLILCYITAPEVTEADLSTPDVLSLYSVQEVHSKRWIPSQERIPKTP